MDKKPKTPKPVFTFRMDQKMADALEEMTRLKGVASPSELARSYIHEGLERDRTKLNWSAVNAMVGILIDRGVDIGVIRDAMGAVMSSIPDKSTLRQL